MFRSVSRVSWEKLDFPFRLIGFLRRPPKWRGFFSVFRYAYRIHEGWLAFKIVAQSFKNRWGFGREIEAFAFRSSFVAFFNFQ